MKHICRHIAVFAMLMIPVYMQASENAVIIGRITDEKTEEAISGAAISIEGTYLWAVSDDNGFFTISNIPAGKYVIAAQCLGYVKKRLSVSVEETNRYTLDIKMSESSLAIDQVVVTAEGGTREMTTTRSIGRNALDHLQASNVTDAMALLPGGKTVNPDLTQDNIFSLRDGGSSEGNASFGTAIEIDGVRLSNNATFGLEGTSTRNIAVGNIESIEIITGVPSAEYGDINSGIVKIRTKKGRTPWNIEMSVNPRTYYVSASKGFDLENESGVINASVEWTRATKQLISPYTSYTRRGASLSYSNTFLGKLKFDASVTGNIGGMNSEDDPDAFSGEYTKERDNLFIASTSLVWLVNSSWITNLKFDASVNFHDTKTHSRIFNSYASQQPAVHQEEEGYFLAGKLPFTFFSDQITDSKELDYAASAKYEWNKIWDRVSSNLKAGVQWKATGNIGEGEYYEDPALSPNGYRPQPYSDYPYMHNISVYAEEKINFPIGRTSFSLSAGLRLENLFIKGSRYNHKNTLSPRINARWDITENFAIRGGWGITEKLPSYYILYPRQEYRDIQTFGFSYNNNESSYVYYTQPYALLHNPDLKWQKNHNSEFGIEARIKGIRLSLVGYYNITKNPYKYSRSYSPFSYNLLELPDGYTMPANPDIEVDSQTGMVYIRDDDGYWTPMDIKVTDRTFVQNNYQDNGTDIIRSGVELVADFPEIKPIRTSLRLDMAYGYTSYCDNSLSYYYQNGWSHTSLPDRSYQYVGIYANGGNSSSVITGKITHSLDANITAITHIPAARIIITCRLEMSLLKRSRNISSYKGKEYAFNVTEDSNSPTGGSIYDGNSYTAIWPVAYMDLEGNVHPFTDKEAENPEFANLILKSNNAYAFAPDGYGAYFSANISITKEIGDHVSISFFANNFTNSRHYVKSFATGVGAIFTPDFYYGLTCRLKF